MTGECKDRLPASFCALLKFVSAVCPCKTEAGAEESPQCSFTRNCIGTTRSLGGEAHEHLCVPVSNNMFVGQRSVFALVKLKACVQRLERLPVPAASQRLVSDSELWLSAGLRSGPARAGGAARLPWRQWPRAAAVEGAGGRAARAARRGGQWRRPRSSGACCGARPSTTICACACERHPRPPGPGPPGLGRALLTLCALLPAGSCPTAGPGRTPRSSSSSWWLRWRSCTERWDRHRGRGWGLSWAGGAGTALRERAAVPWSSPLAAGQCPSGAGAAGGAGSAGSVYELVPPVPGYPLASPVLARSWWSCAVHPSLAALRVGLDRARSSLGWWKGSLTMAAGLELDERCNIPSSSNRSLILVFRICDIDAFPVERL